MLSVLRHSISRRCEPSSLFSILNRSFPGRKGEIGSRWNSDTRYKTVSLIAFDKPLKVSKVKRSVAVLPDNHVRIGVKYCCLNMNDVEYMTGRANIPLPMTPGNDFSGEILEVASNNEQGFKVGDKVVTAQANRQLGGGLAGECITKEDECFEAGSVSLKKAAVLVQGHATALLAFTKLCELKENDKVIVIAGPGGNGLAAIQLANSVFKAKVYAICDTEDISALIREEGAYKSISIKEGLSKVYKFLESSMKEVKAKAVYDAVGGGVMYVAADFVDPEEGAFITADPFYSPEEFLTFKPKFKKTNAKKDDPSQEEDSYSFVKKIQQVDLAKYRHDDFELYRQIVQDTLTLCEEEIINPYVSQTFGIDDINDAVEFIKEKKCTGKVLVDVKSNDVSDGEESGNDSDNEGEETTKNKEEKSKQKTNVDEEKKTNNTKS